MKTASLAAIFMFLSAGSAAAATVDFGDAAISGGPNRANNKASFSAGFDGHTDLFNEGYLERGSYQLNGTGSGIGFSADPGQRPGSTNGTLNLLLDPSIQVKSIVAEVQEDPGAARPADKPRRWELSAGLMLASLPDFEGSRSSSPRALPWVSGSYRTAGWGTFSLDTGAITLPGALSWDFIDRDDYALGVLLGMRASRSENDPSLFAQEGGSERLRGLGSIDGGFDYGLQARVEVFGVPLFAQVRRAFENDGGTRIIVGVYAPIEWGSLLTVTLLPTAVWADGDETQTYFGVTPQQSARSGIPAFSASAGWYRAGCEAMIDVKLSGGWSVTVDLAYARLLGDAARSPIVESADQFSAGLGLTYKF